MATPFDESAEHLQLSDFERAEDVPFAGPDELIDSFMASSGRTDPALRARESADSTIGTSVMEHLESQIAELPLDEQQRIIASHIAGNIDDNGYLCCHVETDSRRSAINDGIEGHNGRSQHCIWRPCVPSTRREYARSTCADCLLLQLRRRELTDRSPAVATAREMVADFFDLFSKRHFDRLCSAMSITRDELKKAAEIVKSLHPKTGRTDQR